jgi:CHRD domain-containing protein
MRYIFVPAMLLVAACTDVPPTSTGRNAAALTQAEGSPASSASADVAPIVFNTVLRAENEPNNASTSDSKGRSQVVVLPDGTIEFTLVINNKSSETYTRAHIHKGPTGVNGPIHWDFLEAGVPVATIGDQPATLRGIARPRAAAVLDDLLANPDQYYVNVHSTVFPGGAMRGQLR